MQAPSDPQALGLLCRQGATAALTALLLEPREHFVEAPNEFGHLDSTTFWKPLAWTEQINRVHPLHEPV